MATTDEPKITMDTIKKCAPILCQHMNRESLCPYLLQCSLLTSDESYHFLDKSKSPSESNSYLIEILETKDSISAQKFYQCLQKEKEHNGHLQIVEHLRSTALQDTSCKEKSKEMNAISSTDESEKERNLVKPEELNAMANKKKTRDITSDSFEAKMCKQKTQILLVTANDFEQYAALSLLEPMEGSTTLLRYQHNYTGLLAKVATYTFGRFGAFNAAIQRMTIQGPASAQDVITIAADCFGHNLNAIFSVGVACGVRKKNNMLDVLVSKKVTFYKAARQGTNKEGKLEIISRDIANLPTSEFLLQHFYNPPEWPTESSKVAASLKTKKPKKHTGLLLSGDYLVDNEEFKDKLLNAFAKEAIGIEMEGAGLYHDYRSHNYEILIVKAVCDFGDGKKNKDYQPTAALLAAECLHHYLSREISKGLSDFYNKKGNAPSSQPVLSHPNLTGDDNWERDGTKHQIHQLQPQPQKEQQAKKQNDDDERDSGMKRQGPADVTYPQQNDGGIQLQLYTNNPLHHKMILALTKYLDQDEVDHRVLYRFFNLSKKQKGMVEDSKTSKVYESLAQYVETVNPTVQALVECLENCGVKDEHIQFIINYKYQ